MDLSVTPVADKGLVRVVVVPAQSAPLRPRHPFQQRLNNHKKKHTKKGRNARGGGGRKEGVALATSKTTHNKIQLNMENLETLHASNRRRFHPGDGRLGTLAKR